MITFTPNPRGLAGQHLREALDGELGRLVGTQPGRAADASADRRELHEDPGPPAAQHRTRRLRHVDHSEQVGLDLGAEVAVVHLLDRCAGGIAGVVDDDIQAPERIDGDGDPPASFR
jgi:hypothetical protein